LSVIKPAVVGDVTWVNALTRSVYGTITSNWKRDKQKLTMDVTIPPNTTATVFVPAKDKACVTESGKPAHKVKDLQFLRLQNNVAVYRVGSGTYRFQSTLPENTN